MGEDARQGGHHWRYSLPVAGVLNRSIVAQSLTFTGPAQFGADNGAMHTIPRVLSPRLSRTSARTTKAGMSSTLVYYKALQAAVQLLCLSIARTA
jgi:hypothetical protein